MTTWKIGTISSANFTWKHECPHCHIRLLTGERAGFCCGPKGSKLHAVQPLPPLPYEYIAFVNDERISHLSRIFNVIFSFASMETTAQFPGFVGPPGFVAIQGRVYHRIRPTAQNSAVRWLLYDGFVASLAPHQNYVALIPQSWMTAFTHALHRVNPFVSSILQLAKVDCTIYPKARIVLQDTPAIKEIAAVMTFDNTTPSDVKSRQLVICRNEGHNQKIPTHSRLWEPLAYPLLFPHGSLGWGIAHTSQLSNDHNSNSSPATTQMWHYRARLLQEPRFQLFGRLANEYIVDMFTRDLETRLNYIRWNQEHILQNDAELMGEADLDDKHNIYLPASFLGSRRWASQQINDALALAAAYGPPTFFTTMTCNPRWPEITSQLTKGQSFEDLPVVVCRVFKRKLVHFLKTTQHLFPNAGRRVYMVYSVEFQKRGLPHAHILLKYENDCCHPNDIDRVISAEIPTNEDDAALVRQHMLHSHPAMDRPKSNYCQTEEDGVRHCRFNYPFPLRDKTSIDPSGRPLYRRRKPGDEMVVAHNIHLLREYQCHLNFECANTSHMFQYLFKYIHKGPDKSRIHIDNGEDSRIDEINDYWDARYLSAGEAVWRILGFHLTCKDPAVTALNIHTPNNSHHEQYSRSHSQSSQLSKLLHYFLRPTGNYILNNDNIPFSNLLYCDYFQLFRLQKFNPRLQQHPGVYLEEENAFGLPRMHVIQRNITHTHITRLQSVSPSKGELFYIKALLTIKPAKSFDELRTVNGMLHSSFQEAALDLGLFADEHEDEFTLIEAVHGLRTPFQLRHLFVHLLINNLCNYPISLWETFHTEFSKDFILQNNENEIQGTNLALDNLSHLLEEYGCRLSDYGLPEPTEYTPEVAHELNRWNSISNILAERAERAHTAFNNDQRVIWNDVMHALYNHNPFLGFVDGPAGRGKTFLLNAICDYLRSTGKIVIATATSAFAAHLLPGGRTTHSAFKVPVNDRNELLTSSIDVHEPRAELLRTTAIIIWDEAPMVNRAVFACVDQTLRNVMGNNTLFGGKIIILSGDFRQTCPVVRRGSRAQIVDASIRSSPLWPSFHIYNLTENIRNTTDPTFATFVDDIGNGAGPEIPLSELPTVFSATALVDFVFPNDTIQNPTDCLTRSILAPTHRQCDTYNGMLLDRLPGIPKTYFAADSLREVEDAGMASPDSVLDYVARHPPPGIPAYCLHIKVGGIYRLLRNLSIDRALVKNMRVVIIAVGTRIITIRIIKCIIGTNVTESEDILLPRITFVSYLTSSGHTLLRRQFPLAPAYATTFNSCQGLTLDRIGIDLTTPVFSHGQLYTALSRTRHRNHVRIRLQPGKSSTNNVTYNEILL